jgi:hypothetical protein
VRASLLWEDIPYATTYGLYDFCSYYPGHKK